MNVFIGAAIGAALATFVWWCVLIYAVTGRKPWELAFWTGNPPDGAR